MRTGWTERTGVRLPIVQAPMGGGATTPALVAAVSRAGGLGCLAAAYTTPSQVRDAARSIRSLTDAPFGVNLFAPHALPALPAALPRALAFMAPIHVGLGLPPPALPADVTDDFGPLLDACLDSGARVLSFTFGRLPLDAIAAAHARGMCVAGTATTVTEARVLEADGVDAIVAQGSEAGAHRGTFAASFEAAMIGTCALVPQVADAVRIPVLASGGIMDGRGIAAALALGAAGAQLGTAFLGCPESGISGPYRAALTRCAGEDTAITTAYSGRPARGIVNRFIRDTPAEAVLPYPYQNALTRAMRRAAAGAGDADYLSLWAGQAVPMIRSLPAAELVEALMEETRVASLHVARLAGG